MAENSTPKQRGYGKPFPPGKSGNPAGKPKGTRHAALLALDAIGQEGAEAVLKTVVEKARAGDPRFADILLRRIWPERKGRPVVMELPPLENAADLAAALGSIAQAVAAGEVTPDEGQAIASTLDVQRRAIETVNLEQRIEALELRNGKQ
jgi:hypothetical protein